VPGRLERELAESRRREEHMARQLLSLDVFKLDVIAREMKETGQFFPRRKQTPRREILAIVEERTCRHILS
jgi:hypothetical protein